MSYGKEVAVEVNVLPQLAQKFATAHSGIECCDGDGPEMRGTGSDELQFIRDGGHRTLFSAFPHHPNASDGISGNEAFVGRPEEQVANNFDVPADLPPLNGKELTNFSPAWVVGEARGYIGLRDRPTKRA
jgi:hypothetical protein